MATYARPLAQSTGCLDDILSPMSSEQFLDVYFGKSFLHLPGCHGKFGRLLPWSKLNRILEQHRLAPPRLRLFQGGQPVPSDKYFARPDRIGPRLQAAELTNLLAAGATLIIDAVDEVHRPVREIAAALERFLRIDVHVNLYAGWRTDQGFLLHYDPHDTLILQVAGRKHWKVYRPTRLYPLEERIELEPAEKPVEEPIWDDVLQDGGLLYIPRGWWHVAYPVDEPTLHLTVGLRNHRGIDLLLWLASELKGCAEARQDIPFLAERDVQLAYMTMLRQHLFKAWTDDLLDRFLTSVDQKALPRPHLELPEAATASGSAVRRDSNVRLIGPRKIDLSGKPENGTLKLKCAGKSFHCDAAVLPALKKLNDGQSHSVKDLIAATPTRDIELINFLQVLALQGLLATAAMPDPNFAS